MGYIILGVVCFFLGSYGVIYALYEPDMEMQNYRLSQLEDENKALTNKLNNHSLYIAQLTRVKRFEK